MIVMVKDFVVGQPPFVALTVIVAVIGLAVLLIAVNEGIELPLPDAANPTDVLLFVHVKAVPLTVLLKLKAPVDFPPHTVASAGTVKSGAGLIPKL